MPIAGAASGDQVDRAIAICLASDMVYAVCLACADAYYGQLAATSVFVAIGFQNSSAEPPPFASAAT